MRLHVIRRHYVYITKVFSTDRNRNCCTQNVWCSVLPYFYIFFLMSTTLIRRHCVANKFIAFGMTIKKIEFIHVHVQFRNNDRVFIYVHFFNQKNTRPIFTLFEKMVSCIQLDVFDGFSTNRMLTVDEHGCTRNSATYYAICNIE